MKTFFSFFFQISIVVFAISMLSLEKQDLNPFDHVEAELSRLELFGESFGTSQCLN